MNPEGEEEFVNKVMESINDRAEQQKGVEVKDTKSWLEDEVKENNERQASPCWSKIPIIDKFYSNIKNPRLSSKLSPDVSNKEEIGSVETDENKERVILFEQIAGQANVQGDIGRYNPEDKVLVSHTVLKNRKFRDFRETGPSTL